jgi:phage tail protein X
MTSYTTKEGDTLDAICWRYYGRSSGTVELTLEANRDLADYGTELPAGLVIILPDVPEANDAPTMTRLWE